MLIVYIFKIASWLCYKVPRRISYAVATIGGELYYWIARNHSRHADRNMRIVLGEPKINRRVRLVARRSFRNYAKYMVEFLAQSHPKAPTRPGFMGQGGWHYFDSALEQGKGLMLVTPHLGNWDAAIELVCGYSKYQLHTVAHDFKPPELNKLIQGSRERLGIKVYSPEGALRGLYNALKKNEVVVLLIDSPLKNEGIIVEMFGKPVRFAQGPATLALKTGAGIMLGYVTRQPGNQTFYAVWEAPLQYEVTGDRERDIVQVTQLLAKSIEQLIRRHPDQWYMFRPLWLTEEEVIEHERHQQKSGERRSRRKSVAPVESVASVD